MKISVIIPCHGRCRWLGAQLEALTRQDWTGDWEVVLADNGMAPEASAIVNRYAQRLPGLRVIDARQTPGSAHARNRGAAESLGSSLIFVDSDDVVAEGWLEAMASALEEHELCASRFEYRMLNAEVRHASEHYAQEKALQRLWYPPWVEHAGGCGIGVRRSAHERVGGFDETLRWLEDTDYCVRMAVGAVPLTFVPGALIHIRLRDSARGRFKQARRWARVNCRLYARYGRRQLEAGHAWREYGADWMRLMRRLVHVHSRTGLLRLGARFGRQVGLLEGVIRYRVPPLVMPHERSIGPGHHPAPDGAGLASGGGRYRRRRRNRLGTLVQVRTEAPVAALTFDDGPDPEYTPRLLRVLEAHGARATFFLIGERAEAHPDLVRRIAAAGHAIGNHSFTHRSMPGLSPVEQARELERCREVLGESAARLFRPPYGQQSEASYRAARRAGNEVVGWSVMSGDWQLQEADELAAGIVSRLEPGAIVLMHDSLYEPVDPSASDRGYAIDAVEKVLSQVGSYMRFVTIPELLAEGKAVRRPWFTRDGAPATEPEQVFTKQDPDPAVYEGRLRLGVFGPGPSVEPEEYESQWVRGPGYDGMQDCDIRGFLDGGFRWAWNQPGQIHVRVGRLGWERRADRAPELGERELFRCLQRWDDLVLPDSAEVLDASLTLTLEAGAPRPADVCLYEVFKDWNPGRGGVDRNNVSVPEAGDVWWNEAEADQRPWVKPGAGQAGFDDAEADTPVTPLAVTRYRPGDATLTFGSADLAAYVQRRVESGDPLLLLIKLSDTDEDRERSVLTFWSAEHGDARTTSTRPRLRLRWRSRSQVAAAGVDVRLERGRTLPLPVLEGGPGRHFVTEWTGAGPSRPPTVQVDDGKGSWRDACESSLVPLPAGSRLRLLAAHLPVRLGEAFRTSIRDTWVTTGPPDEQIVEWAFLSPSGRLSRCESSYRGGYRWDVSLRPDELGTWRYYWTHTLAGAVERGPVGVFDVVAGDVVTVLHHLEALSGEVSEGRGGATPGALRSWEQRLMTLERAAVTLTSAGEWGAGRGAEIRVRVGRVRSALWGRPIPSMQTRVSHDLVTEEAGRPLFDPYPAFSPPVRASGWRRNIRRIRRGLRRLVR